MDVKKASDIPLSVPIRIGIENVDDCALDSQIEAGLLADNCIHKFEGVDGLKYTRERDSRCEWLAHQFRSFGMAEATFDRVHFLADKLAASENVFEAFIILVEGLRLRKEWEKNKDPKKESFFPPVWETNYPPTLEQSPPKEVNFPREKIEDSHLDIFTKLQKVLVRYIPEGTSLSSETLDGAQGHNIFLVKGEKKKQIINLRFHTWNSFANSYTYPATLRILTTSIICKDENDLLYEGLNALGFHNIRSSLGKISFD